MNCALGNHFEGIYCLKKHRSLKSSKFSLMHKYLYGQNAHEKEFRSLLLMLQIFISTS